MLTGARVINVFFRAMIMITIFLSCLMTGIPMFVQYKYFTQAAQNF